MFKITQVFGSNNITVTHFDQNNVSIRIEYMGGRVNSAVIDARRFYKVHNHTFEKNQV